MGVCYTFLYVCERVCRIFIVSEMPYFVGSCLPVAQEGSTITKRLNNHKWAQSQEGSTINNQQWAQSQEGSNNQLIEKVSRSLTHTGYPPNLAGCSPLYINFFVFPAKQIDMRTCEYSVKHLNSGS